MKILFSGYKDSPLRLAVLPGAAISIEARPGTGVRGLEGQVWITQEGDVQDYVVTAGTRFTTGRGGLVVISALGGQARVAVSWSEAEQAHALAQSRVSLDYDNLEQLRRAANRARVREVSRLVKQGFAWLARAWRHALAARARSGAGTSAHHGA